jgi:hypothetical protein
LESLAILPAQPKKPLFTLHGCESHCFTASGFEFTAIKGGSAGGYEFTASQGVFLQPEHSTSHDTTIYLRRAAHWNPRSPLRRHDSHISR